MIVSKTISKIASYESKCTGCGACANVCPKGAIHFVERRGYFRFPEIDETLCTQCGLCLKKCPVVTANPQSTDGDGVFPLIYGTYVKDAEIRARSSSGGMFSVLANYVLDNGGVVSGAAFTSGCKLEHVIVECREDIASLRGSKYLQSDTGLVYKRIKAHLEAGRMALFCGTPCQVAAMKAVAGPDADKLYTVDFFCHGVPPQKLFEEYVDAITDGRASSARNISFRLKNPEGWKNYHIYIDYDGGCYESYGRQDPYVNGFISKLFLRKSCGNCHFSHIPREGDFSVGDAWGLAEEKWEIRDNKGVSILCVNNKRARAVFEQVKDNFAFCVKTSVEAVKWVNNLIFHTYLHPNSARFMAWLESPHDTPEIASKILEYLEKDDNVAIMNFHESRHNYGSVITGYALQEKIKRILGYSPLHIQKCDGFNDISDLRDFCKEHIQETSPCPSPEHLRGLNKHFRTFIVGPDVVWLNAGFFPNFYSFLFDFVSFSKNICSYAASFLRPVLVDMDPHTWSEIPVSKADLCERKRLMKRFAHIGVREDSGVNICRDTFDVSAEHVLDAVFLLRAEDYDKIIAESDQPSRKLGTAYYLINECADPKLREYLDEKERAVSLRQGLSQVALFRGTANLAEMHGPRMCEWLQSIRDCDFFVTDSFHGLCFAIIFRKQFAVITRATSTGGGRMRSLFKCLGVPFDRFACSLDEYKRIRNNPLDYAEIEPRLEKWITKSEHYLECILADNKPNPVRGWMESIEIGQMQIREQAAPKYIVRRIGQGVKRRIKNMPKSFARKIWHLMKVVGIISVRKENGKKVYRVLSIKVLSR